MAFATPALCSFAAILLMVLSASSCRNMGERKLLISSSICSLVAAVLWLLTMAAITPLLSGNARIIWLSANALLISVGQVMLTYYIIRCRTSRTMHESLAEDAKARKKTGELMNWLPATFQAKGDALRDNLLKINLARGRTQPELTSKTLEDYFNMRRPHTDPDLKLGDLAEALDVNPTELSAFINREFGINFRRYVNRWRLTEYERLMSLPSNERKNVNKIISLSGFSDQRHYQRALDIESRGKDPLKPETPPNKKQTTKP